MGASCSVGRTCSISCFSDSESLYKSIKKSGHRNQGGFWACSFAFILYINLPIWTGVHNLLKVMRCEWDVLWHHKTSARVCRWWGVESWVSGLQESVSLIASQPIGGNRMISSNSERRGGKNKLKRPRTAHNFHYPCILYSPPPGSVFGKSPRGRCFLAVRQYAILASLEGFDAWCETKWISFGEKRTLIL